MELDHSAGTERVSNLPYLPSGGPYFRDILLRIPSLTTSYSQKVSISNLVVNNADGSLDSWLDLAWKGWPLRIYIGDPSWVFADFMQIFSGLNGGASSRSSEEIEFTVYDKRAFFSQNIQNNLLPNNKPIPLSIGKLFNVSPVIVDAATHKYQVHDGAILSVDDVRESGQSISNYTADLANGTITLTASPSGAITADITGATNGSLSEMVKWVAKRSDKISSTDLDVAQIDSFPSQYVCGYYARSNKKISQVLTDLVKSAGGNYFFGRDGKMRVFRLADVSSETPLLSLTEDDIQEGSFGISRTYYPRYKLSLGYKNNWKVQSEASLVGSVPEDLRELYGEKYSLVTAYNSSVPTDYPLIDDKDDIKTLIFNSADAQTEADYRANLWSVKRRVYTLTCFSYPFLLNIGDVVKITHPRFGFSSGKNAQVISLTEYPLDNRTQLEVFA